MQLTCTQDSVDPYSMYTNPILESMVQFEIWISNLKCGISDFSVLLCIILGSPKRESNLRFRESRRMPQHFLVLWFEKWRTALKVRVVCFRNNVFEVGKNRYGF